MRTKLLYIGNGDLGQRHGTLHHEDASPPTWCECCVNHRLSELQLDASLSGNLCYGIGIITIPFGVCLLAQTEEHNIGFISFFLNLFSSCFL